MDRRREPSFLPGNHLADLHMVAHCHHGHRIMAGVHIHGQDHFPGQGNADRLASGGMLVVGNVQR